MTIDNDDLLNSIIASLGRIDTISVDEIPGIDLYMEWARNDYNAGLDNLLRYPFHTQAITAGFRKNMYFKNAQNLAGELLCEITFIESSMDYHFFYDDKVP